MLQGNDRDAHKIYAFIERVYKYCSKFKVMILNNTYKLFL